jgi:hypothetical protein
VHIRLRIGLLVGWQRAGRQCSHRCSGVAAAMRKSVLAALILGCPSELRTRTARLLTFEDAPQAMAL